MKKKNLKAGSQHGRVGKALALGANLSKEKTAIF
jgi:hypothetical protein